MTDTPETMDQPSNQATRKVPRYSLVNREPGAGPSTDPTTEIEEITPADLAKKSETELSPILAIMKRIVREARKTAVDYNELVETCNQLSDELELERDRYTTIETSHYDQEGRIQDLEI